MRRKPASPAAERQDPTSALYEFRKNAIEVVRANLSTFRGHELADLRVYYEADDGSLRPTKKGLCVGIDLLPELRAAVEALEVAARKRGLAA
jgi:hypothetical protein